MSHHSSQPSIDIAILVSGGGSNFRAIFHAIRTRTHAPFVNIAAVISDRPSPALTFAEAQDLPAHLCNRKDYENTQDLYADIHHILDDAHPDLVVLAGYLGILPASFTKKWEKKIINMHPSLLPKFGGKGMYGIKVHEAVLAQGTTHETSKRETETGCTVHWVIDEIDAGDIIAQRSVPVHSSDTPQTLQARVLEQEHMLYPEVIFALAEHIIHNKNKEYA